LVVGAAIRVDVRGSHGQGPLRNKADENVAGPCSADIEALRAGGGRGSLTCDNRVGSVWARRVRERQR
jgi:hypothetical protein